MVDRVVVVDRVEVVVWVRVEEVFSRSRTLSVRTGEFITAERLVVVAERPDVTAERLVVAGDVLVRVVDPTVVRLREEYVRSFVNAARLCERV